MADKAEKKDKNEAAAAASEAAPAAPTPKPAPVVAELDEVYFVSTLGSAAGTPRLFKYTGSGEGGAHIDSNTLVDLTDAVTLQAIADALNQCRDLHKKALSQQEVQARDAANRRRAQEKIMAGRRKGA